MLSWKLVRFVVHPLIGAFALWLLRHNERESAGAAVLMFAYLVLFSRLQVLLPSFPSYFALGLSYLSWIVYVQQWVQRRELVGIQLVLIVLVWQVGVLLVNGFLIYVVGRSETPQSQRATWTGER